MIEGLLSISVPKKNIPITEHTIVQTTKHTKTVNNKNSSCLKAEVYIFNKEFI
ncbi:hypothetical protein [Saccharicrinis aurantiacus]|uniref:hypothetical protein n=1 Tax=Saccharicrinis aurantiacus TaxID=1849719 RepID=UPI002492C72C|nr:hypothetical protein [Saccharicrinis aurantiacus]